MILTFLFPRTRHRALLLAAINGLLVVAFGAFGAHALEARLTVDQLGTWQTAVLYHMFHVAGLVAVQALANVPAQSSDQQRSLQRSTDLFVLGILLFSGSLYVLALTGLRWLGMITPLGGLAFLAGWLLLALACYRTSRHD